MEVLGFIGSLDHSNNLTNAMKSRFMFRWFVLLAGITVLIGSCKKDEDPAATALNSNNLQGSWAIVTSEGTEWNKDTGITTPRAPEPSIIGYKFVFTDNMVSIKDISGTVIFGPSTWNLDEANSTMLIGTDDSGGLGKYTIKNFVAGTSMAWDQRVPTKDDDYEYKVDCDCFLYFQKFWTMTKMP